MTKRTLKVDQNLHCFVAVAAHTDKLKVDASKDDAEKA